MLRVFMASLLDQAWATSPRLDELIQWAENAELTRLLSNVTILFLCAGIGLLFFHAHLTQFL
jgi:hypothetical protein